MKRNLAVRVLVGMLLACFVFVADVIRATRKTVEEMLATYVQGTGLAPQANTITNMIPILYAALDIVSRELVGFIPACGRDSSAERAAVGQTVNIYIAPPATTADITPGVTAPNDGDQVFGNTTMTISKSKYSPVRWNGEEQLSLTSNPTRRQAVTDQFAQSMRALVNLVEVDLANAAYQAASRAYGTAGTTPFGTAGDLSDFAQIIKILDDNGAARSDRHMVLGTAAMANIRGKQSVLFKANEAGTDQLLRQGVVGAVMNLMLHDSAGVPTPTKGTGAGYLVNNVAGYAIGATTIAADTGAGTILAGDVVTFAGDTNKYVVTTALAGGSFSIGSPGLRQALADNVAITVGNTATQNVAFVRPYLQLATRAPAMPDGGDMADDLLEITDPVSGLAFQVAVYRQYRQVRYEVGLAWGVKAVKGDGITNLLG
jgi:hypothetical protein